MRSSMTTLPIARTRRRLAVTRGREHVRSRPGAPRPYARTRFLQCRVPEEASRGDGRGLGRRVPLDGRASVSRNIRAVEAEKVVGAVGSSVENRRGASAAPVNCRQPNSVSSVFQLSLPNHHRARRFLVKWDWIGLPRRGRVSRDVSGCRQFSNAVPRACVLDPCCSKIGRTPLEPSR